MIGWPLLIGMMIVGLLTTIDLPAMINAGVFEERMARDLTRGFGFAQWPALLRRIGYIITLAGTFVATTLIVAVRRGTSGLHQLRAGIGAAGLLVGFGVLASALPGQWPAIGELGGLSVRHSSAQLISEYLEAARPPMAIAALV